MKRNPVKAAQKIADAAVRKTGAKKVGNVWNMTPAVRKLEKAQKK